MRQRKFILVLLVLGLVLAGVVLSNHLQAAREKKIMAGFTALMAGEDPTVAQVVVYLDEYIGAAGKEKAATMVLGLERVQQANLARWQQRYEDEELQNKLWQIYGDRWSPQEITGRAEKVDEKLHELLQETIANGYKVETAEGQYFPVIDYTFYRRYHAAVPPELAAYLELMAVESEAPPVKDAALVIGWDEILRRAANQERFLRTSGAQAGGKEAGEGQEQGAGEYRTVITRAVRKLLKRYLGFALYGCDNTPLFDYRTKAMNPEARRAYEEFLSRAGDDEEDGEFSAEIKAYMDVLAENDYRLTPAVDAYREQVLSMW